MSDTVTLDAEAGEAARIKLSAKLPPDVPPIPEGTLAWRGDYGDGVHTVFDADKPRCRWRFNGRGEFSNFVEYEMRPDPVDGAMRFVPKGSANLLSDAVLREKRAPRHSRV